VQLEVAGSRQFEWWCDAEVPSDKEWLKMADAPETQEKKKRTFKKYTYRGVDLEDLVKMDREKFYHLLACRQRRRMRRQITPKYIKFYKRCVDAKKATAFGDKPQAIKTHLRNAIVFPDLVGSVVGIHFGKGFTQVEIKPDMIGHYLGEFAVTYKPVKHGKPGIGATHSSRFIPLK